MAQNAASVNDENLGVYGLVVSAVIFVLVLVTFITNFKYGDNHLNWLNNEYSKNLMISSEEDSVFMTEGGDNQVFGSLYFIYAEKLRPDISPYDQMGNIFKRIYGDMRYVDGNIIARRKKMVDTALFAGEEPFYKEYRSRNDPYFIPYWQGRRPVYLTWQRPEQWTLGDVYYKRYGIMYKVQDIEYQLVDYLKLKKEITVSDAQAQFSRWLHRDINAEYTRNKIAKLQNEGYITLSGGMVRYVKDVPAPYKGDYTASLLSRWDRALNAGYWDTLSREIIIQNNSQMAEIFKNDALELLEMAKAEPRPEFRKDFERQAADKWARAKEYYNTAIKYGPDSLSSLYSVAIALMNNGIEDMSPIVYDLLVKAVDQYKNFWAGYSLLFTFLGQDMQKNPQNESRNQAAMAKYMKQMKQYLLHYRSSRGKAENHPYWKNFEIFEQHIQLFKDVPVSQLNMYAETTLDAIKKKEPVNNDVSIQTLLFLYMRGFHFQYQPAIVKADELLTRLADYKKDDADFINKAMQQLLQPLNKRDMIYSLLTGLYQRKGGDIDNRSLFNLGRACFDLNKKAEAERYLTLFVDRIKNDRQAVFTFKNEIDSARAMLGVLNPAKAPKQEAAAPVLPQNTLIQ